METNSLFDKFESLSVKEVFLGTILEKDGGSTRDDDIQRDGGGGKKIVSLFKTPVLSLMKRYRGDSQNNGSLSIVQQTSRNGPQETRKFYFRTKIMEAFDSSVFMETVDSPTIPNEAQFTYQDRVMKSQDDLFIVLNENKKLICVREEDMTDTYLVYLNIFSSEKQSHPTQNGDTAIYFPSTDGKYYYYLKPTDDSSKIQCPIDVEQVCIEKMTEDQKDQNIRDHLFFSQQYNNQGLIDGACGIGPPSRPNGFTQSYGSGQISHHHPHTTSISTSLTGPQRSNPLNFSTEVEKG